MSEKSTADMIERLRSRKGLAIQECEAIADRLAEHDSAVRAFVDDSANLQADLPNCPTCGGTMNHPHLTDNPCEDCVDGKVSIERLVAVFNAVFNEPKQPASWHTSNMHNLIFQRLRTIGTAADPFKSVLRRLPRHQLPPCPTCGGGGEVRGMNHDSPAEPLYPCPDCKDHPGKVSIEQVVATYNAVWNDRVITGNSDSAGAIAYLRSVKP